MEENFTLPPGLYEKVDTNETLKNTLSSKVMLDITIDDITMRTNLTFQTTKNKELKLG